MIEHAIALLKQGELVVIPTETVYGLAADATNPTAVRKIFALKGRPVDHPVIVHIDSASQLSHWACDIPDMAYRLTDAFWPGPLTLILKKQPWVSDLITGGQQSIGLRAPQHPLTQQLLSRLGGGLAAPSANRFGHVSPTTAQHVRAEFAAQTPFILDGGPAQLGVESTIISLITPTPVLLRPGSISQSQLESVLQQPILLPSRRIAPQVRVSGSLDVHYAPHTPLIVGPLPQLLDDIRQHPQQTAILIHHSTIVTPPQPAMACLTMPADEVAYARALYATLRRADDRSAARILLETPPQGEHWLAIHDRLQRAATTIL